MSDAPPRLLRSYIWALTGALGVVLALTVLGVEGSSRGWWPFVLFTLYLAISEYGDLNFHDDRSRLGFSASEALMLPMLIALPFEQFIWAATIAVSAREVKRLHTIKGRFNVSQFALSAAFAAAIWAMFGDDSAALSPRNALVSVAAIVLFSLMTYLFTSAAISFAQGRKTPEVSLQGLQAMLWNLVGSIVLGILFAAAYEAQAWTALIFPAVVAVFFTGYRAMLRQSKERERMEALHTATSALAASPSLDSALLGFLGAVSRVASARQAAVLLEHAGASGPAMVWSSVREGELVANMEPVPSPSLQSLLRLGESSDEPILVNEDTTGALGELRDQIGAASFIASPIKTAKGTLGCLAVLDRAGADEFDAADAQLLEALANELSVSLDSYRLFAEIAEERERFGRIFNASKEGICLLDERGLVRAWNPALERISGYAAEEMLGDRLDEKIVIRGEEERRLSAGQIVVLSPDTEVELVTRSGPTRWISFVSGKVAEGDAKGWVILVRDVTAEHQIEEAKSDFLSTISHELRTPLTSIKGSLQVLGRGLDTLPPNIGDQMIAVTARGAERLERLVMNLLAVSQLESGTMAVFPDEVDLEPVIRDRIEAILPDHPSTRIDIKDGPIVVRADRERVGHVLEHLLENARKFGGPEGTIAVSASLDKGFARLSVTDEGPGIPEADQERIFDRFVRLGHVLTRETQGPGVGLFIAKMSADALGGRIWVDSEPGKGATFTITLPLAKPMVLSAGADSA